MPRRLLTDAIGRDHPSALTPHDWHSVLVVGRRVAAELADVAIDPASGLSLAVRATVAGVVLAVDLEAHRRAGVALPDPETRAALAAALPEPEHLRPP